MNINAEDNSKICQRPCRKIGLLGLTRNTDNYGVRVLLSSAIEILSTSIPEAEIFLLDYGKEAQQWTERTSSGERNIRVINLRFSWRLYLKNNIFRLVASAFVLRLIHGKNCKLRLQKKNPWVSNILNAEAYYSIAGGDSFSDIYGLRRFLYVILPQLLILLMDKPLILLPQTLGPFRKSVTRFLAKWILLRAEKIFSRDLEGIKTVHDVTRSDKLRVQAIPDLGFFMNADPVANEIILQIKAIRQKAPVVGLNVSSLLYMGGYNRKNMFKLRESFPVLIDALVQHIVQYLKAQVLLVPHVCGGLSSQEDETRLCKKLQEKFSCIFGNKIHYIDSLLDHRQTKTIIANCDMFIGARMHACIGAVSQRVPTLCLAYSAKFSGVMSLLNDGVKVVDLRLVKTTEVLEDVEDVFNKREQLRQKLKDRMSDIQNIMIDILRLRVFELSAR